MCFFFTTSEQQTSLLESSIGPCQFCGGKGTVSLVEQRSKWYYFGLVPSSEYVEQLALCSQCGKCIKAVHYHLREQAKVQAYSDDEPEVAVVIGTAM